MKQEDDERRRSIRTCFQRCIKLMQQIKYKSERVLGWKEIYSGNEVQVIT